MGHGGRYCPQGIEYGSARWGTAADIAPYVNPVPDRNIPLTQTEKLTMSSRPKNPKYARNKNILVIGGSGSGKTRFFVKPSLMQMHSSYVVTDPKGQLLSEVGTMLRRGAPKLDENGKPMRDACGKVIGVVDGETLHLLVVQVQFRQYVFGCVCHVIHLTGALPVRSRARRNAGSHGPGGLCPESVHPRSRCRSCRTPGR